MHLGLAAYESPWCQGVELLFDLSQDTSFCILFHLLAHLECEDPQYWGESPAVSIHLGPEHQVCVGKGYVELHSLDTHRGYHQDSQLDVAHRSRDMVHKDVDQNGHRNDLSLCCFLSCAFH